MANIYYLTMSERRQSGNSLAGRLWLRVSHEAVVKLWAWAAPSEGLTGAGRPPSTVTRSRGCQREASVLGTGDLSTGLVPT